MSRYLLFLFLEGLYFTSLMSCLFIASMPCTVICLMLFCSRWYPSSIHRHPVNFTSVVLFLFPSSGCYSVQCLVHQFSFILAICPAYFHVCYRTHSLMVVMVPAIFLSVAQWAVLSLFVSCLIRDQVRQPLFIVCKTHWSVAFL